MRAMRVLGLLVCVTGLVGGRAWAQDAQNFEPAVGSWNYLSVEGAAIGPDGRFVPSLYINFGSKPLAVHDDDGEIVDTIIDSMLTFDFLASYSLNDRFEIGLAVPFSLVSAGPLLESTYNSDGGAALHDIRLIPKARLLGGDNAPLNLAFAIPISLPTGNADRFAGDDTTTIHPKLIAEVKLKVIRFAANLGYRYRVDPPEVEGLELANELTYGAAASALLGSRDLEGIVEVFGSTPFSEPDDDNTTKPLELDVGVRRFTPWCGFFTGGAGVGITADYGTPEYRIFAGFGWHCRSKDRDNDGVPNKEDKCPKIPEDRDNFQDGDGCPDLDNDGDKIPDTTDKCPNKAEDFDKFEDEDGCPDPDNDKDGVLDGNDQCPDKLEDRDGFKDEDGCPDWDNDGDKLLDKNDKCPMDAEDLDGFEDKDGCPDLDNDKDGIPDKADKCPLEPEVINGVEDEDGCPDEGESKVKVTAEKIEILDRVFFDTNKSTIKEKSFNVLNQVASTLKARSEIKKLRVEGHTDNRGQDDKNMVLSKDRAKAVYDYLVRKGIAKERLDYEGYGSTKPLVPHKKRGAAKKNRRVEFNILEQATP